MARKKLDHSRLIFFGFIVFAAYLTAVYLIHRFESGTDGASIQSLHDALWYSISTLTTVGYGDAVPVTANGRVIGFVFLFSSFALYAFLIGKISSFMTTIREDGRLGLYGTSFTQHTVIVGWTSLGKAVVDQLVAAGRRVAVVTNVRDDIDLIRESYDASEVFVLFADPRNLEQLDKVNIDKASAMLVDLADDAQKLVYILNVKKVHKHLEFVVMLESADLKTTFHTAGVTYAVSKNEMASKMLASYIFEPDVAMYSEEIMSYAGNEDDYDIKQFCILEDNPYCNHDYGEIFFDLKKECNCILIGLVKYENGQRRLYKNPEDSVKVEKNDYLIMIMNGKAEVALSRLFNTKEGFVEA